MISNIFRHAGKNRRAAFCGTAITKCKDTATLMSAIAAISLGGPIHANAPLIGKENIAIQLPATAVAPNKAPLAVTDLVDLKSAANAFNVLANDTDPDGDRLVIVEANADFGAVAFTPEGLLAYAQNPGSARHDKITYTVTDGRGGLAKGSVKITVR